MENLTHALTGAALAAVVAPGDATRTERRLLLALGVLAANMPDADLLYYRIAPPPLGYLMHHRGHTHTWLGLLPQWALLAALIRLVPPAWRAAARLRGRVWALLALALASHIPLDYGNSYGVHPFHPFDARWSYGDAVFIVEPWLWVLLGLPLALRRLRPRVRGLAALTGEIAFIGGLLLLSGVARRATLDALGSPRGQVLDVVLNANPVQPLCWAAIVVEKDEGAGTFTVRRGMLSLRPDWQPPAGCPLFRLAGARAPEVPGAIAWTDEISQPLAALRDLARRDCRVRAWLQFGRAPVLRDGVLSDLRFQTPGRRNFSALRVEDGDGSCPPYMTDWAMPRADLLRAGS